MFHVEHFQPGGEPLFSVTLLLQRQEVPGTGKIRARRKEGGHSLLRGRASTVSKCSTWNMFEGQTR
jgi:hypothetical protein